MMPSAELTLNLTALFHGWCTVLVLQKYIIVDTFLVKFNLAKHFRAALVNLCFDV